jgi:hypothetical protein
MSPMAEQKKLERLSLAFFRFDQYLRVELVANPKSEGP